MTTAAASTRAHAADVGPIRCELGHLDQVSSITFTVQIGHHVSAIDHGAEHELVAPAMMGLMRVPVELPLAPMLARIVDEVPEQSPVRGGYAYEPKWDGFRCLILRDHDLIELTSRMNKSLTRYFPEIVERVRTFLPEECVIDAEIILRIGEPGRQQLDWDALTERITPSGRRIAELSRTTPAELVCFDLIGLGQRSLIDEPYSVRRAELEAIFRDLHRSEAAATRPDSGIHLTVMTTDAEVARTWFSRFEGGGLDGVMVKEQGGSYVPGHRAMLKVKHKRTAEVVVMAYRPDPRGSGVSSLRLGMYDDRNRLVEVGTLEDIPHRMRDTLRSELEPLAVNPTESGLRSRVASVVRRRTRLIDPDTQQVPVRPEIVLEVEYDQLQQRRFRHAADLLRRRPDRVPESCSLDQLDEVSATNYDLDDVLG